MKQFSDIYTNLRHLLSLFSLAAGKQLLSLGTNYETIFNANSRNLNAMFKYEI